MESSNSQAIVEERRSEFIISPSNGKTTIRKAHFLKPSAINPANVFRPPQSASPILPSSFEKPPFKMAFNGWEYPSNEWRQWVQTMDMSQQWRHIWNTVGIRDAIMNSKYKICRSEKLIFRLSERWCTKTNTFIFPWGEVTITLEDLMMMAGYPVLGDSASSRLEDEDMIEMYEELAHARSEITRTTYKKPGQKQWMEKFMDNGGQIGHVAFLVYWLSRFVFPSYASGSIIRAEVFSTAIKLVRGIRVALAPAILANIYNDLSLIKEKLSGQCEGETIRLSAPMQLVQVWAMERFIALQPVPNTIGELEPRMALWDNKMMRGDTQNILSTFAYPSDGFLWRPYTIARSFPSHEFYRDHREEIWILIDDANVDERVESIARFMRVSELPSLEGGYTRMYLPHRVAMQFGIDQDLPGVANPVSTSINMAWQIYSRPLGGRILYLPAGSYRSGITTRYAKWWKELNLSRN